MGCAVPLAIGRKLEEPERTVVATVGDAALEMFLGELATVRDLTLAIPIVIFVNTQLGLTELKQRSSQLPDLAVNFGATDFAAVAQRLTRRFQTETLPNSCLHCRGRPHTGGGTAPWGWRTDEQGGDGRSAGGEDRSEQGGCQGRGGRRVRDHRRGACRWRGCPGAGIRDLRHQEPASPHRTQPGDRRGRFDIGVPNCRPSRQGRH